VSEGPILVVEGGDTQDLFGHIADTAVLLTLPAYFYSALDLIRIHGFRDRRAIVSLTASVLASAFCFIALAGATKVYLVVAMIVMLAIFIFYVGKDRKAYDQRIRDNTKS